MKKKIKVINFDDYNEDETMLELYLQDFLDKAKLDFEKSVERRDNNEEYHIFCYFQIAFAIMDKYKKMYLKNKKWSLLKENSNLKFINNLANAMKHDPLKFGYTASIGTSSGTSKFYSINIKGNYTEYTSKEIITINESITSLNKYHKELKKLNINRKGSFNIFYGFIALFFLILGMLLIWYFI